MHSSLYNIIRYVMLFVMMFTSLQSSIAYAISDSSNGMMKSLMYSMQAKSMISSDSKSTDCEHCKKHGCHGDHTCENGECYSFSAIIYTTQQFNISFSSLNNIHPYKDSIIIPLYSEIYRPPRV